MISLKANATRWRNWSGAVTDSRHQSLKTVLPEYGSVGSELRVGQDEREMMRGRQANWLAIQFA